jgi:Concanavalin A-like lectin/glucanases superfamily
VLDSLSVISSLVILAALSYPAGYILVNTFQNRRTSGLPFFSLLPLYLAVGLAVQIIVSFMLGTVIISPFVPLIFSIGSLAILLFLNMYKREHRIFSIHGLFSNDQTVGNVFCIIMIVVLFVSFARIPISTQWPPAGDAIFHSMFTSLAIYKGHIPMDVKPLDPFPFPYPSGYHVFSADLSLLLNFNAAEAVYILATYITVLISTLLFTLSYLLTKSYWISLPIPFSILVMHNTELPDRWISGYLASGAFPNLFAFMAVITVIVLAQISYNRREAISKITTILLVISIAMFITYPHFLFHIIIFIGVYWIAQKVDGRIGLKSVFDGKKIIRALSKLSFTAWFSQSKSALRLIFMRHSDYITQDVPRKTSPLAATSLISNSRKNFLMLSTSLIVLSSFILVSVSGGLLFFYYRLLTFNLEDFAQHSSDYYLDSSIVIKNFLSDDFFAILLVFAIVSSIVIIVFKKKTFPLFAGFILLIISIEAGLNLIYPQRSLALVAALAWPIIAYNISESTKIRKFRAKARIIRCLVISGFIFIAFYFEMPHLLNQVPETKASGFFLKDVNELYDTAAWLKKNVKSNDLILNDRSYASFYFDAFGIFNLTHNYWSGATYPKAIELMPDASIIRELNHIQNKEYTFHRVPLPTVEKPIKNDLASNRNNDGGLKLAYDHKPYMFLSGSNYTDLTTAYNEQLQLSNFSVGVWFRTDANFTSNAYIVYREMNYGIWMTGSEKIQAGFEASNGIDYFVTSSRSYNDGKWHYAVVTYDGFEIKLYVDGALADRKFTSGAILNNQGARPVRIGATVLGKNHNTASNYFTGNIYDLRIWDRPLVAQQTQQELEKIWLYPNNKDMVYSLLKKFNVKYIVINSEVGFKDYTLWGGTGYYLFKPYYNEGYETIFNSYDFLKLKWKTGNSAIYSVKSIK